ncbi:UDP-3-O-(3-hydroxymyristoyl)glucosamine N-acyltransferase [Pedobacter flavus]|uniref:UDP-3-O-acylglucosamine N-acyltransferase n=1 Tax=Pedobacter flavus TaxID=3113906 RepID=A0ABU7GZU9_9SPHI|nr:UDP-3-O-(3-hydroxymyristoyl)glucosamine N-acyltransferase [Pedobacter sp. VNH31]MEE1884470.1 UDP-3-O-(3-hydroxymyristoyl)glucosamine N-acyltransferase [Pedobacter sp. VNH31]
MQFTAQQINQFLNGTIEGDENAVVYELSKIEGGKEGSLCFISNPKYEHHLYTSNASVVIISKDFKPTQTFKPTLIKVDDPYSAFSILLEKYDEAINRHNDYIGVHPLSFVHESAKLGDSVYIGPFVTISENVVIGERTKVYSSCTISADTVVGNDCIFNPGVKIYKNSEIGNRVIVHSNTVIGSDGFGFAPQANGTYHKIAQIGNVIIEDDVEIGANTTIDRATMGSTIIRKGAKIDNLIQIAHNVEVGENTVMAAQSGVSGSTKVGNNSVIGGQVGIAGHLTLAKGTQIGAQAGIQSSILEENKQWQGSPAQPLRDWMKSSVYFKKLPSTNARIEALEEKIKQLEELLKGKK